MLRITESESSTAAQHYFGKSLSRGDYYLDGQEIAGTWSGRAAQQLDLEGPVERDAFMKLLENERPDGSPLTARTVENRRPGYDFTFDVPKSVSLVHSIGGDERIPDAMRRAVAETMREMEEEMHARVRKNGAYEDRRTGNMIWADFTHLTSRPAPLTRATEAALGAQHPWVKQHRSKDGRLFIPDPHLHVHVYALNATYDPFEAQWKAGEFMRLKRDASYYQAAYHVRLAGELQRLGYTITPTGKGFEITGISRSTVDVFSRRTKEVEEAAKALGITDADEKAALGAKTRLRKNAALTMNQLRTLWRTVASKDEVRGIEAIAERAKGFSHGIVRDEPIAAREAVHFALDRELERVSEASQRRVLGAALERAVGSARVTTVRGALEQMPGVLRASIDGEQRLTTMAVLREEADLMALVRMGRGRVRPVVPDTYSFSDPLFQKDSPQTREQRSAILHVLHSQDWIVGVFGRAGTGKTTMLKEVAAGLKRSGHELVICAPTAEAARGVLRGEGFEQADTVKRLLTDVKMQEKLRGGVLWVDEAGMLGNRDTLELLRLAKRLDASRVVLAGDPSQIRSVPRGDAFRFLEENAGLSVARLESIQRQKDPTLKQVVEAMSRGESAHGMGLLDRSGGVLELEGNEAHRVLASAYAKKTACVRGKTASSVLVVCPTHREGEQVTEAIRAELRSAKRLALEEHAVPRTVNLSWTDAEKRNPAQYEDGLVVQFKQNAVGFRRSERVRVTAIEPREGLVMVTKNDGREVALPIEHAERFQVYRIAELKISKGDRLRVTENGFDQSGAFRLNNGDAVVVEGFDTSGNIKIGKGRVLPRDYGLLDHGYVVTADGAQAKTVDTVFAAIGRDSFGGTDMRRTYVTLSRARHEVRVFTDDREGLLKAAQRDTERRSATELVGRERAQSLIQEIPRREAQRAFEQAEQTRRQQSIEVTRNTREAAARRKGMEVTFG
jgi:hypothetical protein